MKIEILLNTLLIEILLDTLFKQAIFVFVLFVLPGWISYQVGKRHVLTLQSSLSDQAATHQAALSHLSNTHRVALSDQADTWRAALSNLSEGLVIYNKERQIEFENKIATPLLKQLDSKTLEVIHQTGYS